MHTDISAAGLCHAVSSAKPQAVRLRTVSGLCCAFRMVHQAVGVATATASVMTSSSAAAGAVTATAAHSVSPTMHLAVVQLQTSNFKRNLPTAAWWLDGSIAAATRQTAAAGLAMPVLLQVQGVSGPGGEASSVSAAAAAGQTALSGTADMQHSFAFGNLSPVSYMSGHLGCMLGLRWAPKPVLVSWPWSWVQVAYMSALQIGCRPACSMRACVCVCA